ncbi:N-acetyltransferase GCN5 [Mycena indigotica]|uniref:N-acetyltransferase GCN5 n=1 Tax=Mycena indigotica TaxID=2126181 RepID=A0A8H6T230_9AGAR|nr:N-acetyltransferase GCN5 [Mycena indigotica]KAF7309484.1 N-acetyltransferase GCN5 [Mycena indigotica]
MTTIRPYNDKDFEMMFAAFNARVEWLVSKGLEDQWGAEPWGDDIRNKVIKSIPEEDAKGAKRWVAEVDGESVGWLVMTPFRSDYIPVTDQDKPGNEAFLKTLLVKPGFSGRGIGEKLLEVAKQYAREEKAEWLRLDCYRGPAGKDGLVKYYESKGFTKARAFAVPGRKGKEWTGQLLEMAV